MVEFGRCSAPEGCTKKATSYDHFTPRCVAYVLGWDRLQVNDPMNLQPLCQKHHTEKDRNTPKILDQVRKQLKGGTIRFGEAIT